MELEGSLLRSQVPTTCPYPEPADPVHAPTSHFPNIHLNSITIYAWVFQVVSFPQDSPPKTL